MTFTALKPRLMQIMLIIAATFSSTPLYANDWVYTVKPGDTLWDLCLSYTNYKACWLEVPKYNGVDYPPSLAPGTRIRFPVAWLKAQPVPASISHIKGKVLFFTEGQAETPAAVGDSLPMGSHLKTLENSSATLLFADGATLILEPNSHVIMDLLSKHQQTGMVSTRLNLVAGGAKSRVPKHEVRSNFSVSTPSAIAAVRGTDFRVSAEDDQMRSEVFEGNIMVVSLPDATAAQEVSVAENQGLFIQKGESFGEAIELLPATTWENADTAVILPYTLNWKALPKAASYKLELLEANSEKVIVMEHTLSTGVQLPLDESQCVIARLSAIDSNGLQGMPNIRDLCVQKQIAAVIGLEQKKKTLHWQAVDDAVAYRVESSKSANFSQPKVLVETKDLSFSLSDTHKGDYLRIVTIDNKGLDGAPSEAIRIKGGYEWLALIATLLIVGLGL